MTIRRGGLTAILVGLPAVAHAHAFAAGQGTYDLFLEGASLPFHTPELTLAVVSLGLLVGLWDRDGMPIVWPGLIAGAAFGLVLPRFASFDPILALHGMALLAALLAALSWRYSTLAMRGVAALAGSLIAYGAAAGHGLEAMPVAVLAGIFAGVNFFVAAVAGLASLPQRRIAAAWPLIGLRVMASWLAAITMMMAAFAVR